MLATFNLKFMAQCHKHAALFILSLFKVIIGLKEVIVAHLN